MIDGAFIQLLKDTFLKADPEYHIDRQPDYEPLGIRLIQKYCGGWDPRTRTRYEHKSWVVNGDTYTNPLTGEANKTRWDMSTDGEHLIYRLFNGNFNVIDVERIVSFLFSAPDLPVASDGGGQTHPSYRLRQPSIESWYILSNPGTSWFRQRTEGMEVVGGTEGETSRFRRQTETVRRGRRGRFILV